MGEIVQTARTTIGAFGDVLQIASENPDARAAGASAGKSLKILADTVHSVLLPLAVVNYGVQKFQTYIQSKFTDELAEALGDVDPEDVLEPPVMVAGPTLAALVYAHEEEDVRRLFVQLLASGMDGSLARDVHPAFVEVIKQLDPKEVDLLRKFLNAEEIATTRMLSAQQNYHVVEDNIINLVDENGPFEEPRFSIYLTNWVRLGLFVVDYTTSYVDNSRYAYVEGRPEYRRAVEYVKALRMRERERAAERDGLPVGLPEPGEEGPHIVKGRISATPWGLQFARVVKTREV